MVASLFAGTILLTGNPVLGQNVQGLQVITIEGGFLDWQGNAMREYDYLQADHRYRLLPGTRVEVCTLDGRRTYYADGPGILLFDSSGEVFVNGKALQAKIERPLLDDAALHETSSPSIAGIPLRGGRIAVETQQGKKISLYDNSYALVVGNGDYVNGWDPLPGAIGDVGDVAKALEKNGFNVVLKTNITKEDFSKEFWKFCYENGRNEDNRLLFYYAGHGYTQKMETGEDLGYLVMVDAPLPEKDPMGFDLASVDMQSIVTQAKMVKAKHVLFMFDSCFSGSVLNFRGKAVPENISESVSLPVRQFITAGRANEPVPDRSIFKLAFLDLLEGRDKEPIPDGYITGEELGLYLKNKVSEYDARQHPQYGRIKDIKLDKGDFVFILGHQKNVLKSKEIARVDHQPEQRMTKIKRERPQIEQKKPSEEKVRLDTDISSPNQNVVASTVSKNETTSMEDRFISYGNGTVLDKETKLMWAAKDADAGLYVSDAIEYCENYSVGGYEDWRMPSLNELETLYDKKIKNGHGYHITNFIEVRGQYIFALSSRWGGKAAFDFKNGVCAVEGVAGSSNPGTFRSIGVRTLPVRSAK